VSATIGYDRLSARIFIPPRSLHPTPESVIIHLPISMAIASFLLKHKDEDSELDGDISS